MTTHSVSSTQTKTISLTYIPPLSSNTQSAKLITATATNLEPTPNPYPKYYSKSGAQVHPQTKINSGHHPNNPRPEDQQKGTYNTPAPMHNIKKYQKKKSTFEKGTKSQIPVQFQQDYQGEFPLGGANDTKPQGWEGNESEPHKGGTLKQRRKWGIHQ